MLVSTAGKGAGAILGDSVGVAERLMSVESMISRGTGRE